MQRMTASVSLSPEIMITGMRVPALVGLEPLQHLDAVHVRHQQIEEDQVEVALVEDVERLAAGRRRPRPRGPLRPAGGGAGRGSISLSSTTRMRPTSPRCGSPRSVRSVRRRPATTASAPAASPRLVGSAPGLVRSTMASIRSRSWRASPSSLLDVGTQRLGRPDALEILQRHLAVADDGVERAFGDRGGARLRCPRESPGASGRRRASRVEQPLDQAAQRSRRRRGPCRDRAATSVSPSRRASSRMISW